MSSDLANHTRVFLEVSASCKATVINCIFKLTHSPPFFQDTYIEITREFSGKKMSASPRLGTNKHFFSVFAMLEFVGVPLECSKCDSGGYSNV